MGSGKHRRAGWATGLSLILHALALTGMALGLRVVAPPPEDRAIELRLIPSIGRLPPPQIVRQPPERSNPAPSPQPRPAPRAAPQAVAAAPPQAPAPAPAAKADTGPKTYGPEDRAPGASGLRGCDDPLGVHLTPEQRQICVNNLARLTREAKPIDPIPADKRAEYDRYADHAAACRAYKQSGVPGKNWVDPKDNMIPDGRASNIDPTYGTSTGMGRVVQGC